MPVPGPGTVLVVDLARHPVQSYKTNLNILPVLCVRVFVRGSRTGKFGLRTVLKEWYWYVEYVGKRGRKVCLSPGIRRFEENRVRVPGTSVPQMETIMGVS